MNSQLNNNDQGFVYILSEHSCFEWAVPNKNPLFFDTYEEAEDWMIGAHEDGIHCTIERVEAQSAFKASLLWSVGCFENRVFPRLSDAEAWIDRRKNEGFGRSDFPNAYCTQDAIQVVKRPLGFNFAQQLPC